MVSLHQYLVYLINIIIVYKKCVHTQLQLCLTLCNPMNYSLQVPLSMGFSRPEYWFGSVQEYWSGLLFPPPGDLPDPGIKPMSSCTGSLIFYHCAPGEANTWDKEPLFRKCNDVLEGRDTGIYGIEKNGTEEPICRVGIDTDCREWTCGHSA